MNKKLTLLSLSFVLLTLLAACGPAATPSSADDYRSMNVNGTGQVTVVPDMATINIGVRTEADGVNQALEDNTAQANAIAETLQEMGVAEKDIQTANFNVFPNERYDPATGQSSGTYYVVENTVNVTVRDLTLLGDILTAVVNAGANNIYGVNFNVSDREAAIEEARKLAIQDAQAKAQSIAEAAGVQLGDLMNISVYSSGGPRPYFDAKGGMGESAVPIAAGTLVIAMEANLTYQIK